jgi:hypothetical protein
MKRVPAIVGGDFFIVVEVGGIEPAPGHIQTTPKRRPATIQHEPVRNKTLDSHR